MVWTKTHPMFHVPFRANAAITHASRVHPEMEGVEASCLE
jgi:hypothetical protein